MGDPRDFGGVIGRYRAESTASWSEPPSPPYGAPNVLLVVLDDVGFAQLGCFGSDIETPTIDALASEGLRYSNFHTTALCSPTRASLLTGRNHHAVGMGRITDLATGFPGYDARIPDSAAMLPALLTPHGYAAWAVGKWHLTPDEETHLGAPRHSWPLGRGFERFYGFMHGETHQFEPALVHDNHRVEPTSRREDGYHLTEDLIDRALEFHADLRHVDPDRPWFLWLATGACHSPHQAPGEWRDRYRGRFDDGWDVWRAETFERQRQMGLLAPTAELSERPEWVPAWASLSADEQRLYARYMECFAAYLAHTDAQLGRLIDRLRDTGDLDRTLILVMSDNGASSEGGPTGSINDARPWNLAERPLAEALERIDDIGGPWIHNNYPWGWTVAGNTPFRRWKREVHEGGVCDPLVVHWPGGIPAEAAGSVRHQYVHAVDVLPTVLAAVGIDPPDVVGGVEQVRIDGVSFGSTFDAVDAAEVRDTQYFEMFGCRALYHEGWKAVTYVSMWDGDTASDDDVWELYHVAVDPAEVHDLAAAEPARLASMIDRWWVEAEANQVLPIDSQPFLEALSRPPITPPRGRYVYWAGSGPVEEVAAVNVRNRRHRVTAELDGSAAGAEGVLVSQGSGYGGWVLWMADGRLHYAHNFVSLESSIVTSDGEVGAEVREVGVRYAPLRPGAPGGVATLEIDGVDAGSVEIPRFTPTRFSICGDGLTVGRSMGLPVVDRYRSPSAFTGPLRRVVIEVSGEPVIDPIAEANQRLRAQ